MKKFFITIIGAMSAILCIAQNDTTKVINLDGVSVISFQRNTVNTGSLLKVEDLIQTNYGQEPSNVFRSMPSIISLSDNGTEFGYGYSGLEDLIKQELT